MNLKDSFRYQNFLDKLMKSASESIKNANHGLKVTKIHHRKKVNPAVEDLSEKVQLEQNFYPNDDVVAFMAGLVEEKRKLTEAITRAKAGLKFDIDAAIETNKFRQNLAGSVRSMLRFTKSQYKDKGMGYKFNNEGNQVTYYYEIDVISEEAYDKTVSRKIMRNMIDLADRVSGEIDAAMITALVDYSAPFDVNGSFEDAMEEFLADKK